MPHADQELLAAIQPELVPGESVLWVGRPSPGVIFGSRGDPGLIPFSLMSGGFAVVWETMVIWSLFSKPDLERSLFAIVGIPFVVMGQYMIWGRFVRAARQKRTICYAVTNQRVIVVQNSQKRQVASAEIRSLPSMIKEKRSGEVATLRFYAATELYPKWSIRMSGKWNQWDAWDELSLKNGPVFVDIKDADSVYQLISALQSRASEAEVAEILRQRNSSL